MEKMNLNNKLEAFANDLGKALKVALRDAEQHIAEVEDGEKKTLLISALKKAKEGDISAVKTILNGLRK